ncbi:pilus assembly protein PilX [Acinetobacter lanii]|uniref:Pilus assembly protein PilX n=1 Tax=Acinetobacter lanii TaxID=2715163 RepID=A0A6G8S768_9GAMM|nr:pilus assembly protein PilX [Acinetobacter lanii]QIO09964.1 pilus assembly protein PilX [Acinetobacter lanii]
MIEQRGSTLIVTLIILLLIVLVGTMAVRSGILGLRLATNSQIQILLLENSNAALFNIEDPNQISRQLAQDGMFSYFNAADHATDELVFCYRASENNFFSMSKASAISHSGDISKIGLDGFCKANQFSTGRSAIISQVYIKKNLESAVPFSHFASGTSLGQSNLPVVSNHISVTVISTLPSFAHVSTAEIEQCFKKLSSEVSVCFSNLSIPYNTQHADYVVGGKPELVS